MERLDERLARSARHAPGAVAVREKAGSATTYAELDALADEVARGLVKLGIGAGDRVGLCRGKSALAVAALFGIMRAGAAYVPVDPAAPRARSAGIFSDCGVRAILTDATGATGLAAEPALSDYVAAADEIAGMVALVSRAPTVKSPAETAYILYTSGSTGKPKGVTHTHASALAYVDWCCDVFAPQATDCFSSHAPFHFDLSILDIYVPVTCGASIRVIDADEGKQPAVLVDLMVQDRITNWYSTPTILRAMTEFGGLEGRDLSRLKVLCFAGEVFPTKHLKALARLVPGPRYFNLFGPTETNVCTYYELPDPLALGDDETVPIGYPASGDLIRIIDPDGTDVPEGEPGELIVAEGSVMTGYWGDPERTAASFIEAGGHRWYRTGDVVERRPDGALHYRGRRDRMVKRRGYRIELGEIEAAMSRHPEVSEVAAVAVSDPSGDTMIVGFYSSLKGAPISLIGLKQHAAKTLPIYMVPDRFAHLDELPHTSTDKTDYQRLKDLTHGFFAD